MNIRHPPSRNWLPSQSPVVLLTNLCALCHPPMSDDAIIGAQCRAARRLVRLSIGRLAHESGVGEKTIGSFEQDRHVPIRAHRRAIRRALEAAGVGFTEETADRGPGIYLLKR